MEIVGEAADGGRKVIVFSYFREAVLNLVIEVLAGRDGVPGVPVLGPLTGDIS